MGNWGVITDYGDSREEEIEWGPWIPNHGTNGENPPTHITLPFQIRLEAGGLTEEFESFDGWDWSRGMNDDYAVDEILYYRMPLNAEIYSYRFLHLSMTEYILEQRDNMKSE